MSKRISIGDDVRTRLLKGAQTLCKAVSLTFGPRGRTAMLDRFGGLLNTKDGVTVAREISLSDPVQNQGAQILKQACISVNDEVGDGTTTTAILAAEILRGGHKLIAAGINPRQVVEGMRNAVTFSKQAVYQIRRDIYKQADLKQVALMASNYDEEIADGLSEACMAVGKDGTVSIEDSPGVDCFLEFKEGMELDKGAASSEFLGDAAERVIEGALVAVINADLRFIQDVQDIMETASQWPKNELVVFALGYGNQALTTMVINDKKDVVKCCAIGVPGVVWQKSEILRDIAAVCGADFCDPDAGYNVRAWDAEWFGSLRKITITNKSSLLQAYPEAQQTIQKRVERLKSESRQCSSDYDRDRIKERLAKLTEGLAIFKVGGATESALKERRGRVEDALESVQAALTGGVIPGGGAAYLAVQAIAEKNTPSQPEMAAGYQAVMRALSRPTVHLAESAGDCGAVIVQQIQEKMAGGDFWVTYDVKTRSIHPVENDIIDPAPVAISAIEAAVFVASTLLTVDASIHLTEE